MAFALESGRENLDPAKLSGFAHTQVIGEKSLKIPAERERRREMNGVERPQGDRLDLRRDGANVIGERHHCERCKLTRAEVSA